MSPSQQKVLYLTKKHGSFEVHTANVLKPGPGQILVKVEATALNPVDWKIQKYDIYVKEYPAILGADAAGTVEELGEGVTGFAKGDRVCVSINLRLPFQLSDAAFCYRLVLRKAS